MKKSLIACLTFAVMAVPNLAFSKAYSFVGTGVSIQTVEHGGGCRKSSPPGKCCHMDNKKGRVHCH